MAVAYELTLKPITSKNRSPIFSHRQPIMTGEDTFTIYAGYWYEVPNVWELISLRIELVTDATVANRKISIKHIPDGTFTNIELTGDNVAASTTKAHYLNKLAYKGDWNVGMPAGVNNEAVIISGDGKILISCGTGKAGDTMDIRSQWKWKNWQYGMEIPYALRGK